jgi:hypothetical protein
MHWDVVTAGCRKSIRRRLCPRLLLASLKLCLGCDTSGFVVPTSDINSVSGLI